MTAPNVPVSVPVFDPVVDDVSFVQSIDKNIPDAELNAFITMVGVLGDVQGKSTDLIDAMVNLLQPTMIPTYKDSATITMKAGRVACQSADATKRVFRKNTSDVDITAANLDAGGPGFALSTQYYIYAIADAVSTTVTFKISTSASAPAGATIFGLVGTMLTDASGNVGTILPVSLIKNGMMKVQSGSVTAQSSFTISGLCPGAKYKLVLNMVQNTSNGAPYLQFNGDSGANYRWACGGVTYGGSAKTSISCGPDATYIPTATYPFLVDILFTPSPATNNTEQVLGTICTYGNSGMYSSAPFCGHYVGAAPVASVTASVSAGTMTGTWTLYQIL